MHPRASKSSWCTDTLCLLRRRSLKQHMQFRAICGLWRSQLRTMDIYCIQGLHQLHWPALGSIAQCFPKQEHILPLVICLPQLDVMHHKLFQHIRITYKGEKKASNANNKHKLGGVKGPELYRIPSSKGPIEIHSLPSLL